MKTKDIKVKELNQVLIVHGTLKEAKKKCQQLSTVEKHYVKILKKGVEYLIYK